MVTITPAKYNPLTMVAPKAPVKLLPKKKVDFSSIAPQVGVIDPLAQAKVGTKATGSYNITPSIQQGAVGKSASDIYKTKQVYENKQTIASQELVEDMKNVISEGRTPDINKLKQLYPEFSGLDDNVLKDLTDDIGNVIAEGREVDPAKLKSLYPELYEFPTAQPKVNTTLGDKIMGGISKVTPIVSPLAGVVQKIGAKNVLNAGVGVLEGAGSVGGAIGQGLAYLDPTITVDEYKRGQENIDAQAPQLIKDIRGTKAYGVGKEVGKIGASTALTYPIGGAAKGVGLLGRAALGATEGVLGTAAYNVASGDEALNNTTGIAGAIGWATPLLGAGIKAAAKYVAPRLQLSGLLNPAKLNQVKDMLIDEGSDLVGKMDTTDVGKRMIERGFKGGKDDIIKGLTQYSDESKKALDGLLASSKSKHNVPSAKRALENIRASYADIPGLESKFSKVDKLLSKDAYTLTELNAIKREMDDAYNLFKSSGGETAGLKAEGLRNIRKDIRKYIEDAAESEGLGNVKMLNNETSVSRTLADAVSRKDSADIAREMLSVFSKPAIGGALSMNQGPFNGNTIEGKIGNFIVGGLLAGALFSTTSKTYMANALRGLSGLQKKELSRFIATKGTEQLSKETVEEVAKITNAIRLLKEGPLERNPLRLTTPAKSRTLGLGATQQTKKPLSLTNKLNANTTDNILNNTSGKTNQPRVNQLSLKKSAQSDTLVSKADDMNNKRIKKYGASSNDINIDARRGIESDAIIGLSKELKELPSYEGKVIRTSDSIFGKNIDDVKVGDILSDKGFLSSSKTKSKVWGDYGDNEIIIQSKTGKDITKIKGKVFDTTEPEVLFDRNTKFEVTKKEGNKVYIKEVTDMSSKESKGLVNTSKAPKELQPLYDEARKYKSAEEFVNNVFNKNIKEGDIVYYKDSMNNISKAKYEGKNGFGDLRLEYIGEGPMGKDGKNISPDKLYGKVDNIEIQKKLEDIKETNIQKRIDFEKNKGDYAEYKKTTDIKSQLKQIREEANK